MPLLSISGLQRSFVSPDGERKTIVDVPSFALERGQQLALRGESGAGKTTFLHLVAGILAAAPQKLVLNAVANPATGETVGDTSLFETPADWLKTTADSDATLKSIAIRGTTFADVKFNFPKGNDSD